MSDTALKGLLYKVSTGASLSESEMGEAMDMMTRQDGDPAQMGAFLMALRLRGETVDEITGAAGYMRAHLKPVTLGDALASKAVDIVGTGGDSHGTYNVSTCAALVAAGAGLSIAKHGNRSVSSLSGASDVLAALGVKLDVDARTVAKCVAKAGVGFMWAPMHHPAMKYWAPIRASLGLRTIFNLLGPISNPAGVKRQLVGVFAREWVEPIANTLKKLGARHVWVVHGADGMDELTTTGPTSVTELKDGSLRNFEVSPGDAGLKTASLADLKGGDADHNAQAITDVLAGQPGAFRDIVVFNTAAALIVGAMADDLKSGAELAAHSIDSGGAKAALEKLIAISNAAA